MSKQSDSIIESFQRGTVFVDPSSIRRRTRILQTGLGVGLGLLALLSVLVRLDHNHYFSWDLVISRNIQAINLPGFHTLMHLISVPGNNVLLATSFVATAALLLVLIRHRLEAGVLILATGLGQLVNTTMKLIIGRPRPNNHLVEVMVHETSLSFPSGHVMHYVVFYGFLFFLTYVLLKHSWLRFIGLLLWGGLVATIGVSRVYLGAHWPSDVTGAYLAGGICLTLSIIFYGKMRRQKL